MKARPQLRREMENWLETRLAYHQTSTVQQLLLRGGLDPCGIPEALSLDLEKYVRNVRPLCLMHRSGDFFGTDFTCSSSMPDVLDAH